MPSSGDTLFIGKNRIYYDAYDGDNQKNNLSKFQIFLNDKLVSTVNFNGTIAQTLLYIKITEDMLSELSNVNYYIKVFDKRKTSAQSNIIKELTISKKPATPDNLTLIKKNDAGTIVTLSWNDNSTNEQLYQLWRKDGSKGKYRILKILPQINQNTYSYDDYGLKPGINYYYKVRAINRYGASRFSNQVNTSGIIENNSPSNLTVRPLGTSAVLLKWKDNSDTEFGFLVERLNNKAGRYEKVILLPENTTEYIDKNLTKNTDYKYRIGAYFGGSEIAYSNVVEVTTGWADIPAPTDLTARIDSIKRVVVLTWSDNTNQENGTYIERKLGEYGEFKSIGKTKTDVNIFEDGTAQSGNTYYYRVRHNAVGGFSSLYSNVVNIYFPLLPPSAPTNLEITEFTLGVLYGLTWKDNSHDETGFELQRRIGKGGSFEVYKIFVPNVTAYNDSIKNSDSIYYYRVRAFRDEMVSKFSNIVKTSSSQVSDMGAPSSLRATLKSNTIPYSIDLLWKDRSTKEYGFIIERKDLINGAVTDFREIKRVGPNTIYYRDTSGDLVRGGNYYYRIRAYNAKEKSDYSNTAIVQIPW